jgi:uncharacterized damage-inducible protein DinB
MQIQALRKIFERELKKLETEINLYQDENKLWHTEKNITNSAGNLCLHLVGNLTTYIGAHLGNTNYVRNRELEFSAKNIAKQELIQMVQNTSIIVDQTLQNLSESDLQKEYPILVLAEKTTTAFFLLHLACHLSYHLGQINYHRRLMDI